jgi:hypothetical protein
VSDRPEGPAPAGLVVEFVGRAGVGKTTIARRCLELLAARDLSAAEVLGWRIPWRRRFDPRSLAVAIRAAWALRIPLSPRALATVGGVYKELVKLEYAHMLGQIVVFDQGLFQRLEGLKRLRLPDERRRRPYLAALRGAPLPDLLVMVTASPETLAARRTADERDDTTAELERRWLASMTTIDDVGRLRTYEPSLQLESITVHNDHQDDVEEAAAIVARRVHAMLAPSDRRRSEAAAVR